MKIRIRKSIERFVNNLFNFIYPEFIIKNSLWYDLWVKEKWSKHVYFMPKVLASISFMYIIHHFIIDKALGLNWVVYRMSAASGCLFVAALYYGPLKKMSPLSKIPVAILFLTLSYFQTKSQVWYNDVPNFYSYVFVVFFSLSMRLSFINTVFFCLLSLGIQFLPMLESGVLPSVAVSGIIVTTVLVMIMSSAYSSSIKNFLLQKEALDVHKQLIQIEKERYKLQEEYIVGIEKFLPNVIGQRINYLVKKGYSVSKVVNSVLEKKERYSTILMCDIREYTKSSKDIIDVKKIVYPAMKRATDSVETTYGINRKVGDLIMGYYDYANHEYNVVMSLIAGLNIISEDNSFNNKVYTKIKRHVIITSGNCIVGNLGSMETSTDITAMGRPVNLCSRIEDFLKKSDQHKNNSHSYVYLDKASFHILLNLNQNIGHEEFIIHDKVRDFPEIEKIYLVEVNMENRKILEVLSNQFVNIEDENNLIIEKEFKYYDLEDEIDNAA